MSILKVVAGGKTFIVDSASKGTAKSWGRTKLDVVVEDATGAEITEFLTDGGVIEKLEAKAKKAADAPAEEGEAAAQ